MDMTKIIDAVFASLPEIVVIVGACVVLMGALVHHARQGLWLTALGLGTLTAAAYATFAPPPSSVAVYSGMFAADTFARFFKAIFYLATALTMLVSSQYLEAEKIRRGEYLALLLFALSGLMIMASGLDLVAIFVGMELQAIAIYVLTGYLRSDVRSNEAALKYVILGAFSSGLFLYGLSLFYGLTGTTELAGMAAALKAADTGEPLLLLATLFLVAGLLFKVGAVPLHMWIPDVYEGAPTPITAFMSVAPKAAAFAVIIRLLGDVLGPVAALWLTAVAVVALLTLALGSFAALVQTNIKRLLAYSSIAHAGFLLLGIVAGGSDGLASVMLYLLIYGFMNLGAFTVVILVGRGTRPEGAAQDAVAGYAGLAKSRPLTALAMLIFLFSLAGIPPTAGFFAKFYVLMALVQSGHMAMAIVAVLLSAVAAYFYIRIVMLMYMRDAEEPFGFAPSPAERFTLGVTVAATLALGILPAWFLDVAQKALALANL